jgi:hypothetical protein
MKAKYGLLLTIPILFLLAGMSLPRVRVAEGESPVVITVTGSPAAVDGTVASSFSAAPGGTKDLHVSGITVTGPRDGAETEWIWKNTPVTAHCSGSVNLNFGTGVGGWSIEDFGASPACKGFTPVLGGAANTHCQGPYKVNAEHDCPTGGENCPSFFEVAATFGVPEFGPFEGIAVTAVGFALIVGMRKFVFTTVRYSLVEAPWLVEPPLFSDSGITHQSRRSSFRWPS